MDTRDLSTVRLGGSSVERWARCTASVKDSVGLESDSVAAEDGRLVHAQLEAYLKGESTYLPEVCSGLVAFIGTAEATLVECRVQHPTIPALSGTADIILDRQDIIEVIDFKNGTGEVVGFEQQLFYGVLYQLQTYGAIKKPLVVVTYQPNNFGRFKTLKAAYVTVHQQLEALHKWEAAYKYVEEGNTTYVTGAHCKWCKAAAFCEKLREEVMQLTDLQNENLVKSLDGLKLAESWAASVKRTAIKVLSEGGSIAGYNLVPTDSRESWRADAEDIAKTLDLGIFEYRLLPIPQAAALVGRDVLEGLTERVSKGFKVVKSGELT